MQIGPEIPKGREMSGRSDPSEVSSFLGRLLEDCDRVVRLAEEPSCAGDVVAPLRKIRGQPLGAQALWRFFGIPERPQD
ncbi:MAG: hypothetical protein MI919_38980 [Holophagales bacterium]|nr:hypothetical protein [Holophagales bacterium]